MQNPVDGIMMGPYGVNFEIFEILSSVQSSVMPRVPDVARGWFIFPVAPVAS